MPRIIENFNLKELLSKKKKSTTLVKQDLVDSLYERIGDHSFRKYKYPMITFYSRKECKSIIEKTLEIIKETLVNGENVLISGFGQFIVQKKKERIGRNPAKKEPMKISARKRVRFKCSGKLRERVNG